jgi:peptidoglycan/LPS O-acetylase OafA/YrhL
VAPNLASPGGNPRFPLFDALRAVAALAVFAGHVVIATHPFDRFPTVFAQAAVVAKEGVAIFFLISGFLLYRPFLTARVAGIRLSLADYARRRVLRIVPAYWVALSLFLLGGLVSGVTAGNWWVFYGFGQIYGPGTIDGGIGVAWTLCIEVTFYLALPAFALLAERLGSRRHPLRADVAILVTLAAASLAYRFHFSSNIFEVWRISTLPGTFFWFALGMGLAIVSVAIEARGDEALAPARSVTKHPTLLWAIALIILIAAFKAQTTMSSTQWGLFVQFVLQGLTALLVLLPGVFDDTGRGLARSVLRLRGLAWIGLVSYAFYLYHPVVIEQVMTFAREEHLPHPLLGVLAVSFLVTCACAASSYYLVERPIMRIKRLGTPAAWRTGFREPPRTPVVEILEPAVVVADEQGV